MAVIATICARGGSKGVPKKNIKKMLDKPLIQYSIEQAKACNFIDHVVVSTDDQEIAEIARKLNALVPFIRPPGLALDDTPKLDVISHLVGFLENDGFNIDVIIDLDVTSPLRDVQDIINCYNLLDREVDIVITGYKSNKNPYFNMVEINTDGFAGLSKPGITFSSRQAAPNVYAMNASIYVWHRKTLSKDLWSNSKIKFYEMPEERSIDIDSPIDWELVQLILQKKLSPSN